MSFTPFRGETCRRDFGKMALGGALGALLAPQPSKAGVHPNAPGIKLCAQSDATPSDDQLLFLKQIGAEYVSVRAAPDMRTAEGFMAIKKRYADAGITVWNIGNTSVHNMPEVTLNLPGRDRKIEEYKQYIRNLGQAGIYYTTYAHMGNGIWTSGRAKSRGAIGARVRYGQPQQARRLGREDVVRSRCRTGASSPKKRSGRTTPTSSSRWRRWRKRTVCASASTPTIRRCRCWRACRAASSATSTATARAMEIAGSPNVGICLCCGTWLEGGKALTGKDPEEMIRYFGAEKIWKIHFRNVSAPLPHFVETFMDNGYYDMYKIMKALRDVNFDGIVILDHSPGMVGGNYAQTAYGFAYMRALLNRAIG